VQGNENSLHMLLASDFILNGGLSPQKQYIIAPWLLETRNVYSVKDPARGIAIPDVDPAAMLLRSNGNKEPDFSMAAGDFVSIYSHPKEHGQWNCVVSCFFLDTAPCVAEYLNVMYKMLTDNGILVSFGPLLYHWSAPNARPDDWDFETYKSKHSHLDARYLSSVDMTWEDVKELITNVGFQIIEEQTHVPSTYTSDVNALITTQYKSI